MSPIANQILSILGEMPKHKTVSMSDLSEHAERIATDIETSGAVYRINRRGHKAMVLADLDYVRGLLATLDFLNAHPNWKEELAEHERLGYMPLDQWLQEHGLDTKGRPLRNRSSATRRTSTQGTRIGSTRAGRARLRAS